MSTEQEPICPTCGYLRTGIEPNAKCPECGADGLDGWLVVVGQPRISSDGFIRTLAIAALCFGIAAFLAALMPRRGSDVLAPFAVIMLLVSMILIGARFARRRLRFSKDPRIIWCAHPDGISIRRGKSIEFIARGDIASIGSDESVFGEMTVLSIVRRRTSAKGLVGTTPYLYLRGSRDERATIVRSLKQVLAPPSA